MALDKGQILRAAMAVLDEQGLDGLTMRRLGARLGVQAPTLYWHFRDKAALVNELADVLIADEVADLVPPSDDESWQEWLAAVGERMRRAMLAHRDGARLISSAHLSQGMADVEELAMRSLVERGVTLFEARLTVLAVLMFTIGFVLEEQSPPPDPGADFDLEAFTAGHPTAVAAIKDYFAPGRTVDDLYRDCLDVILR